MSILIRVAGIYDAALITTLSRQTFYDTFHAQNTTENMDLFLEKAFKEEAVKQEILNDENTFLLAYDGDEVSGYAKLSENNIPESLHSNKAIEIARIYALANKIGKGIGRALMQQCINIAIQKKKDVIWLGVWEQNFRAIDFYKSWGFEKFDEHIFMVGNDAQNDWLMRKDIL